MDDRVDSKYLNQDKQYRASGMSIINQFIFDKLSEIIRNGTAN